MSIPAIDRSSGRMSHVWRYCVASLIVTTLVVSSGCGVMGSMKRKKHDNTAFSCGESSPAAPR